MNDNLFTDALRQLLEARCTPQVVREVESTRSAGRLWQHIEESGFADVLVPEAEGGAGASLSDAFSLFEMCGAHAVPVPLSETMLARSLLSRAGAVQPPGSIAFGQAAGDGEARVTCPLVTGGQVADWVLVGRADECRLLDPAQAERSPGVFCLDATLSWPAAAWAAAAPVAATADAQVLQACACAALLAGAMMSVFERTLRYANERQQFGRPIGKFQAIQHQLSVLSEQAFAARMAAQIGCHGEGAEPDRLLSLIHI